MNKLTQEVYFRQALILYAEKYGVTKAAIQYKTNGQYIYRWKRRYDGTRESLINKSCRPQHHPNEHRESELKLINDMYLRNRKCGLVVLWVKLRERGYSRSITSLYRILKKRGLKREKPANPKYVPKPYEQMRYPGQRIQIDVKYVPASCMSTGVPDKKFYQYTAIDECTRFRYLEGFDEQSQYNSAVFMSHVIKRFKFRIECVQTDNGFEFTNRFTSDKGKPTLFDKVLEEEGIEHKLIRPFTPRHNGKVERSHRKDNEYFYASHKFYSLEDFNEQLAVHCRKYNNFPMRPLNWKSPREVLDGFLDETDSVTLV